VSALAGSALVVQPRAVLRAVAGRPGTSGEVVLARLLGLRALLEGGVLVRWPRTDVGYGAAVVEWAHAATMVAAGRYWESHRRPALASAGVAMVTGTVTTTAAWATSRPDPVHRELPGTTGLLPVPRRST
jgi:hypothetical protein